MILTIRTFFKSKLTQQTAIFGFHNIDKNTFLFQNYIFTLTQITLYTMPENTDFYLLKKKLNEISNIKYLQKRVAVNNQNTCERFRKKWHRIENKVL